MSSPVTPVSTATSFAPAEAKGQIAREGTNEVAVATRRRWVRLWRGRAGQAGGGEMPTDVEKFESHKARLNEFHAIFEQIFTRVVEIDDGAPEHVEARLRAEYEALGELQSVLSAENGAFRSFQGSIGQKTSLFLGQWRMSDGEILSVQGEALGQCFDGLAQDIKRQQVAISARLIEFA